MRAGNTLLLLNTGLRISLAVFFCAGLLTVVLFFRFRIPKVYVVTRHRSGYEKRRGKNRKTAEPSKTDRGRKQDPEICCAGGAAPACSGPEQDPCGQSCGDTVRLESCSLPENRITDDQIIPSGPAEDEAARFIVLECEIVVHTTESI